MAGIQARRTLRESHSDMARAGQTSAQALRAMFSTKLNAHSIHMLLLDSRRPTVDSARVAGPAMQHTFSCASTAYCH